ncbi:Clr5 domain-containing protein [Biscogniauxia marginata]|nr:Clr5 domain-containing protein [Biscogniauxia marginata]
MALLNVAGNTAPAASSGNVQLPIHPIIASSESSQSSQSSQSPPSQQQQQQRQERLSPASGVMEKQHTESEWDAMYPHIIRLYIGEQLILGEVMRIMETRYNFKATQSMYKKRISKWQLHKYKRKNRPNTQAQVPMREDALVAHATNMAGKRKIASIHVYGSGNSKDRQMVLTPRLPDVTLDQAARMIIFDIQAWTMSSTRPRDFGLRETPPPEPGALLKSASIKITSQMYVTFCLAEALYARNQGLLAGKALRKAFLMLEAIIRCNDFGLEWALVDLLYDLVSRGRMAVYKAMTTHIANIARLLLPPAHPLPRLAGLLSAYEGDVATMLQRAYYSQIDAARDDPAIRAFLRAHNPTAQQDYHAYYCSTPTPSPSPSPPSSPERDEMHEMMQGIRATHCEVESMKGPLRARGGGSPPTLHEFVQARTRRTIAATRPSPDPLLVGASDRMLFSEHNPYVAPVYRLKARAYRALQLRSWGDAVAAQRLLLAAMRERTAVDYWGIIRELWALERMLVRVGGHDAELGGVRAEVAERVATLLRDIPDDGF